MAAIFLPIQNKADFDKRLTKKLNIKEIQEENEGD